MDWFSKIVLCANHDKLMVGIWRFGRLKFFETFQNDAHGHALFKQFLQNNNQTTIYLLVDALEEDYRLETLPHTRGHDRKSLLERKLNQHYRGQSLRAFHFLGRDGDQAQSDLFLLMALNSSDFLQDWLSIIEAVQAPLAGIYLCSMIAPILAKRLNLKSPHIIFTEKLSTGLRQSYLKNGDLRMSRLVKFPNGDVNPAANFYVNETEKARMYLSSQHYIESDTELAIVIPTYNRLAQALCKDIEALTQIYSLSVELTVLVKSLRLEQSLVEKTPELVHMALIAKSVSLTSLAESKLTQHYQINTIRKSLNLATATILGMGLIFSLFNFKQSFNHQYEQETLIIQTKHQLALYHQVAKDFPKTPLPSSEMQLAVELNQRIKQQQRLPERCMQVISNAMVKAPEIQINRFLWIQSNDLNLKDDDILNVAQTKDTKALMPALSANELHEIVFVCGEIKRFTGDYHSALNSLNEFAKRLRSDTNVAYLEILQAPVNLSSSTNLEGSTTDELETKESVALFKLKVILKQEGAV